MGTFDEDFSGNKEGLSESTSTMVGQSGLQSFSLALSCIIYDYDWLLPITMTTPWLELFGCQMISFSGSFGASPVKRCGSPHPTDTYDISD